MATNKLTIQDSDTTEKIIEYLASSDIIPERLYQFTSYQALISILSNRSFRLSRTDLLNDKAEMKLGDENELRRSYVISFTEKAEYVSMWTMYGKAIGVKLRLDFDRKKLVSLLGNKDIWFIDDQGRKSTIWSQQRLLFERASTKKPIRLSRVVYYDKFRNSLRTAASSKDFPIAVDKRVIDDLTGFVKYSAWESEKETRLRIVLKPEVVEGQDIKYIQIKITDELIKDFHITFNPWLPDEMKTEIKNSLNCLSGFSLNYSDSVLAGQIDESILHS